MLQFYSNFQFPKDFLLAVGNRVFTFFMQMDRNGLAVASNKAKGLQGESFSFFSAALLSSDDSRQVDKNKNGPNTSEISEDFSTCIFS